MPHTDSLAGPDQTECRRAARGGQLHRIGKFYVFLRQTGAQLFDEAFEAELAAAYQPRGWRRCRRL